MHWPGIFLESNLYQSLVPLSWSPIDGTQTGFKFFKTCAWPEKECFESHDTPPSNFYYRSIATRTGKAYAFRVYTASFFESLWTSPLTNAASSTS